MRMVEERGERKCVSLSQISLWKCDLSLCRMHYRHVPLRQKKPEHFSTDTLPPLTEEKAPSLEGNDSCPADLFMD